MMNSTNANYEEYYNALDSALESHGYNCSPDPDQVRKDYDNGVSLLESINIWLEAWGEEEPVFENTK